MENMRTWSDLMTEAREAAQQLNIDFSREVFTLEDLARGMAVEYEHGVVCPECPDRAYTSGARGRVAITNVTNDDPLATAKIALAHLLEDDAAHPDYYDGLAIMEMAPTNYWRNTEPQSYWRHKKIGYVVVIIILLIAVYAIGYSILYERASAPLSMLMSTGAVALGALYLLITWK